MDVSVRDSLERDLVAQDDWIVIAVSDTGIGMQSNRVESAFEAFAQSDPSKTRRHGGTDLGLEINRHYCELAGGVILAENSWASPVLSCARRMASATSGMVSFIGANS